MARSSWLDDDSHPDLDAHMSQLEHFATAIADGVVDSSELSKQESLVADAMRAVESTLDDATHTKVTRLLAEVAAYTVMQVLYDMAQAKVRRPS